MGGTSRNSIARLHADGTLDMNFAPSTDGLFFDVALQRDGKVLLGGSFTSVNGTLRNNIARLNSDGSLDAGFDPGTGTDLPVRAINSQTDGKVLIGGSFHNVNDVLRPYIARISTIEPAIQSLQAATNGKAVRWARRGSGPVLSWTSLEVSIDGTSWTPTVYGQRINGDWSFNGLNLPFESTAYIRARGYYGSRSASLTESVALLYLQKTEDRCDFFTIKASNDEVITVCL